MFYKPEYFQDLEGKIPANIGDRVALMRCTNEAGDSEDSIQPEVSKRPRLIEMLGQPALNGSHHRDEYLESKES